MTWSEWNGADWVTKVGGLDSLQDGNTVLEIQTGFTNLVIDGTNNIDFAFDITTTDSGETPYIDNITINWSW